MPLSHLALSAACVAAALAAVVLAQDRASRAAHVVMALAMVAMPLWPASVGPAAVLLAVLALVLAHRSRRSRLTGHAGAPGHGRAGRCAVDSAGCALLLGLGVALPWLGPSTTPSHRQMAGMPGMAAAPAGPAEVALRVGLTVLVLATWQVLRRRTEPSGRRGSTLASWLMVLTMGAMTATG